VASTDAPARNQDRRLIQVQGMPLRRWLGTTPGLLRAASVVLVVGLLALGVVAATSASARGDAARAVGFESAPELVAAQNLYVALSDADTTASTIFLTPGRETPELRQRYLDDLGKAGRDLAAVSGDADTAPAVRRAVATITEQLSVYVGRIDTARANIQQGYVVGAAYQRDGSRLMREQILPAATTLYRHAARGLDDNYRAGTSTNEIVFVVVAGVLVLLLLLGVQLFVTHRTNRVVNVGLAGASILVIVMLVWTVTRFASEQDALVRAQRNGSDQMQVLSAARFLTLRAQSDDNLAHVERSAGDTYLEDFDTFSARLGGQDGTGGLLGEARTIARRTGSQDNIRRLGAQFATFRAEHDEVLSLDDQARYDEAVTRLLSTEAAASGALDDGLTRQITQARQRLDGAAGHARGGFDALAIAIPLLIVLAGVLVLIGLERRIAEYQ
jgi:hypothetical protein